MACLDSERRPLRHPGHVLRLFALLWAFATPAPAATLSFTVVASEPVTVTGSPRLAIDVGGVTRYATYSSGSSTAALTFSYAVGPGDFDPDGITLASPLDLNGGSIVDSAGNSVSPLTFTLPDTSALRVQTYTIAFDSTVNLSAVSFVISKAPAGADYTWTISSDNGSGTVSGNGTFSGPTQTVSGIDVTGLAAGTLTLSVTARLGGVDGQPRLATTTPALTGALDGLPTAAAIYSVRRVRGAYPGPLMSVRSSAGGGRDIGATFAGSLDLTTLGSFCQTNSCFVSTWYDQSGGGKHAVQSTQANQFRIVNAGTVERNGAGRIALRSLTPYGALSAPAPVATSAEFTIVAATQTTSLTAQQWLWAMTDWPGQVSSNCPWENGTCYFDVGATFGPPRVSAFAGLSAGTPYIASFANSVSKPTQFFRINGVQLASDTTGHSVTLQGLTIMNTRTYSSFVGYPGQVGTISEFIVFPSLLSDSSLQSVEQSMTTVFGP